jgi:Xaa-Pro dipeptidase
MRETERELAFPQTEFEQRLQKIQHAMKGRGVDALVLSRGENIFYATGFKASHFASWLSELHAVVVPGEGAPSLVTRALELETTKDQWTPAPRVHMDHEDPYPIVADMLARVGAEGGSVGIEKRFLKLSQFEKLQRELPRARFVDASGLVEGVAASPSPRESACIREAARITNVGFQVGLREIREGVYPYEIIGKIHAAMYAAGQRDFDMSLVCIWSGPQGGRMHDTSTTERIRHGDMVTVEVWGVDNHYKAGAQASIHVGGEPPDAVVAAYDLVVRMHDAAQRAVRPGAAAGDVFEAASAVYRSASGKDYYRRCGGSMGLTVFTTDLVKGRPDVLNPGVALLVQTLVDDPVLLTCASTVMVTDDGCEILTSPNRSLHFAG